MINNHQKAIVVPIATRSYSEVSTSQEFLSSLIILNDLHEKVLLDYDLLKVHVEDFKKTKIKLIGNPFVRIQTDLFELTYKLKLHILNCRVYNDLLFEDVAIDDNLNLQLESLLTTTKNLCDKYQTIKEDLRTTPYPRRSSFFV